MKRKKEKEGKEKKEREVKKKRKILKQGKDYTMKSDSSIVSNESLLLPSAKYFLLTCDQCVLSFDVKAAISNSASFVAVK